MAMKDFDFKQFLLQRGELLGLGVAVLLAAVLLLWGSKGFLAGSPGKTAQEILSKKQQAEQQLDSSTPPPDLAQVPSGLLRSVEVTAIDPQHYQLASTFITTTPQEDTKRRNPEVLRPKDFTVKYMRAPYLVYEISKDGTMITVLQGEGISGNAQGGALGPRLGMGGPGGRFGPPGGDDGGSPDMGGPGGGGDLGQGGPAGAYGTAPIPGAYNRKSVQMEISKIGNNLNAKFAEQIAPYRVAMVSAAFPYKEQLENFRRALLRKGTMNDLLAGIASGQVPFQFVGFDIQRRVTLPNGRIKDFSDKDDGWKDFNDDFRGSYVYLFRRTPRLEEEDPKLLGYNLILDGLVMRRPALARGAKHPAAETEIPSIKKTIEDLEKAIKERNRPIQTAKSRYQRDSKDFNPFSTNPLGDGPADPNQQPGGAAGGELGTGGPGKPGPMMLQPGGGGDPGKGGEGIRMTQEEPLIPEYVLLRFLDLTVLPGHSYEYRIRVKMANPNFNRTDAVAYGKLAKEKELVAPEWAGTVGQPVRVPEDQFFYAVDEKPAGREWPYVIGDREPATNEKVPVQVHQWLPYLPGDRGHPVANWVLAERLLVHRGESIGRNEGVEVPVWDYVQETDALAASKKGARTPQRVPLDFTVRSRASSGAAMLVDFEGGDLPSKKVGGRQLPRDLAPVQLLIMAPDGRLIARNSADDVQDPERIEVHKNWRQWITDVRFGRKTSGTKLFNDSGLPRGGPGGGAGPGK